MSKDFFVILNWPNGEVSHMNQGEYNDLVLFETEELARKAAKDNPLGEKFGYEIFEIGCGSQ